MCTFKNGLLEAKMGKEIRRFPLELRQPGVEPEARAVLSPCGGPSALGSSNVTATPLTLKIPI